jgi:non-specific serine/threonine protein kinase
VTARSSDDLTELAVLDKLSTLAPEDPDTQYVTLLLDKFSHVGPNGIHQCLVFDAMSATAATLVEELPENLPKMRGIPQRYPKWIAKRMLLQLLRALSLLHRNGIVHSDVQPGNLLFSIEDLDGVEQQELKQNVTKTAIPLTREDGKTDRWAPSSLYLQEPLHSRANLGPELYVKLSDFGAGTSLDSCSFL